MEGTIPLDGLAGGLDLQATLESGQSYLWQRADDAMYSDTSAGWYHTVHAGEVIAVRQRDDVVAWRSTTDADEAIHRLLRLDDDLPAIRATAPVDDIVQTAFDRYWGLRVVADPFFPTLISFICSTQMRVERIYQMQTALREAYGRPVEFRGETYHAFPRPATLADTTETDLRELGLGYRAPYVLETARLVESGTLTKADIEDLPYEQARETLTGYAGVGQKVADCVLLFALSYLEAIPLDTWMQTLLTDYYPACQRDSYAATSRALRAKLGGAYAGYVQTYLFHHLRTRGSDGG
ncbi:MAG: DNA-3-methyladenine glycosylase [Halobacteriaceae archaeon]